MQRFLCAPPSASPIVSLLPQHGTFIIANKQYWGLTINRSPAFVQISFVCVITLDAIFPFQNASWDISPPSVACPSRVLLAVTVSETSCSWGPRPFWYWSGILFCVPHWVSLMSSCGLSGVVRFGRKVGKGRAISPRGRECPPLTRARLLMLPSMALMLGRGGPHPPSMAKSPLSLCCQLRSLEGESPWTAYTCRVHSYVLLRAGRISYTWLGITCVG